MKKNLTKRQRQALMLLARNDGLVDTLRIAGSTGHSLYKRRLVFKHNTGDDYEATSVTYELSEEGWRLCRALGYVSTQ